MAAPSASYNNEGRQVPSLQTSTHIPYGRPEKSLADRDAPRLGHSARCVSSSSSQSSVTQADSTYYSRAPSRLSLDSSADGSDTHQRASVQHIGFSLPTSILPTQNDIRIRQKAVPIIDLKGLPNAPSSGDTTDDDSISELPKAQVASAAQEEDARVQQQSRHETAEIQPSEKHTPAPITYESTQMPIRERNTSLEGSMIKKARIKILAHKHAMQAFQISINGFFIFTTWWWPKYYYILLPCITATVALNVIMVFSVIFRRILNSFRPEEIIQPEKPESMVFLIPCYNETKEELLNSLDSLVAQKKIENHQHAIMIMCDGKARGPGMEKSTGDYLLQDILTHKTERKYLAGAYTAWDQQPMDVVIQKGTYGGIPYFCVVKQQNQGKRDGLIVIRSFLYNFNRRQEKPSTIYSPDFFNEMCSFMVDDAKIDDCQHLIGMDADTVFEEDCIFQLLEESRYANTVGVCGYVAVDWKTNNWNPWRLYQSAEYTIAQCLRRLHQSMVTHKVSCLPGCCQLLKVCEETCGDHVLIELFGYCPVPNDSLLKQIRATASEDRNHVCHMLSARPKAQTRQALRARAFTDVPNSWSVFLSQRRRWTLGATSNDLLLFTAPGVQWFERILAIVNVVTWVLNPFIIASLASFIIAILRKSIPPLLP